MERSTVNQEAYFIKVVCGGSGCHNRGEKWLFYEHNGYVSKGGKEVTKVQKTTAENIAYQHERQTGHNTRLIEGGGNG